MSNDVLVDCLRELLHELMLRVELPENVFYQPKTFSLAVLDLSVDVFVDSLTSILCFV